MVEPKDLKEPEQSDSTGAGDQIELHQIVEAVLFASSEPLSSQRLVQILGTADVKAVRRIIDQLNESYGKIGAAFSIEQIAGGYQLLTRPDFNNWLSKLHSSRAEQKLSHAALETLAVVAYKQPILRVDIEAVRGVASGEMLRSLMEKGLIKIVGRAEELGRPMLYGTTRKFLEIFGLGSLKNLPKVEDQLPPPSQPQASTLAVSTEKPDTSPDSSGESSESS